MQFKVFVGFLSLLKRIGFKTFFHHFLLVFHECLPFKLLLLELLVDFNEFFHLRFLNEVFLDTLLFQMVLHLHDLLDPLLHELALSIYLVLLLLKHVDSPLESHDVSLFFGLGLLHS